MASAIKPIEVLRERWARESTRDLLEALASGERHERIARAVSFFTGHLRTVSRRRGQSGLIVLPGWAMEKLGVKIGDHIVLEPTGRNTVELRRVTEDDLPEIVRSAVERASRLLPARQPTGTVKHFPKCCEQCGEPYVARRAFQRFCPSCGRLRRDAQKRAYERLRTNACAGAGQTTAENAAAPR